MHDGHVTIKMGLGQALHKLRIAGQEQSLLDTMFIERHTFIESGSTNAYIALEICKRLEADPFSTPRHFMTNNLLAYMTLITQPACRIRLYPGCPSGKYGATFGSEFDHGSPEEFSEQQARSELRSFLGDETEVIMLAMSRLNLRYGPHVGSRENALFKYLLIEYARERNIPIVVTLDYSKIEIDRSKPSTQGGCHAFYTTDEGEDSPWDPRGFEKFCDDISHGLIFLIVGYENPSAPPLEVENLREQVQRYNNEGDETRAMIGLRAHPSKEMGILSVSALNFDEIITIPTGQQFARILGQV